MSRTYKDEIQQSYSRHPYAPYWKYSRWAWHTAGRKSKMGLRSIHNRIRRARVKAALQCGLDDEGELVREPPRFRKNIAWVYW